MSFGFGYCGLEGFIHCAAEYLSGIYMGKKLTLNKEDDPKYQRNSFDHDFDWFIEKYIVNSPNQEYFTRRNNEKVKGG